MNKYTQLTHEERVIIADLYRRKKTYYFISNWLKRKYDTIKDEIERNGDVNKFGIIIYAVKKAEAKCRERRLLAKKDARIIENNSQIQAAIMKLITEEQLSPDEIAGRYKTVSCQTIYNWIYRMDDEIAKKAITINLRRRGKKYRKPSKLHTFQSITAPKTMIDERPEEINLRTRLGDFEGDTVLLNGLERLYTLVDRKSGFLIVRHIQNGHADTIYQETLCIHEKYNDNIHSITFDNGVEFSYHDLITADTSIPIYFAFPYHSWERGTNENTNGLLRQYLPKGEVHGTLTASYITELEDKLNNRPRKRLNYLTPYEVFMKGMKLEDFQVQVLI